MIHRRRAMTLVELLVSLALLGMLASLASVMWTQLRAWGDDTNLAQAALRPHRVYTSIDAQWNRRAQTDEEHTHGRVSAERDALAFVTHEAILHRGWPTVEAKYRLEAGVDGRASRLVYEETRLGPDFGTTRASERQEPLVLLANVQDASLRFRVVVEREERGGTVVEERWVDRVDSVASESVRLQYVELRASVKGETIRWVGVVEPLR